MQKTNPFRTMIRSIILAVSCAGVLLVCSCHRVAAQEPIDLVYQPYLLDTGLVSRSISFENPTGAPGGGG